jgi:hypothetical protein
MKYKKIAPDDNIQLVHSRMIVGFNEYHWQNIIRIELNQSKKPKSNYKFGLLALLMMTCIIYSGHYWLIWAAFIVVILAVPKTRTSSIIVHYRNKNGQIQALQPLESLALTEQEKLSLYETMRKAHLERG